MKINSPGVSARARWLHDHWPVAEMLWSLLTFRNFTSLPAGNLDQTLFQLFKYDEHSGAAQVGWPKLMTRAQVDQQNAEYVGYVESGRKDIQYLIDSGLQTLLGQKEDSAPTVAVFNPLSWQRSDIAVLKTKDSVVLRDSATGKAVAQQRVSPDEIAFVADNIPSVGYKAYRLERTSSATEPIATSRAGNASATLIENSFYQIRIRASDGAVISILDKALGVELVTSTASEALNRLIRWIPAAEFPTGTVTPRIKTETGPLFDRLIIQRPGSMFPETRITLLHGFKRIEISNWLDRDKMPFVASNQAGEYYSFLFPFRFDSAAHVWLEDGIGFHEIPNEYLPGARTDAGVPQHAIVLVGTSDGKPIAVTLSQREAFFDYLPGLPGTKGNGAFLNSIRATVMRKQDQGETRDLGMVNFPTVEPGLPTDSWFSFSLSSSAGSLSATESSAAGWSFSVPLMAVELDSNMSPVAPAMSYFSLNSSNVIMLAFKSSADENPEHYTVRLQEIAGQESDVDLKTPLNITAAEQTSMTEDRDLSPLPVSPVRVHLSPHETVTLRLTVPHPHKKRSEKWWEWSANDN